MTARIKTQEEADLEQIAADVAAVGDALVAIMDRHRLLSERVRALLAGSCLGCTRYPGERHDDDCTLMVDPECDYCGADDDRHEPDESTEHISEQAAANLALLLPIPEAAAFIGVGRSTVYELIGRGEIASVHIGRRHLVPRAALEQYVDRLRGVA